MAGGAAEGYEAQIAELEEQVTQAAKSSEAEVALPAELAALKEQGESDRIDFSLWLAGCRNVKAARAVLADYGGDVDRMREDESWLFAKHAASEGPAGKIGLPNAGAASDGGRAVKRWREIAGLDGEQDFDCVLTKGADMSNSIAFAKTYAGILDEAYKRASVSGVLDSGHRVAHAGRNAKEIMVPKISVTGLGDYTRNEGNKTGAITYEFETKMFNYDRGVCPLADVMDVHPAVQKRVDELLS